MKKLLFAFIDFLSWPFSFLLMSVSAVPVIYMCLYLFQSIHIILFLSLIPVYYFCWLFIFLIMSSIEMSLVGIFLKKPKEIKFLHDIKSTIIAAICHCMSRRLRLVWSLPCIEMLLIPTYTMPFITKLVLKSYSFGKVIIGPLSAVYSFPTDPDLCLIGSNVVIGAKSLLVSHAINTTYDNKMVYKTDPIIIEDDVTIGAQSVVTMGVNIKKGALIKMGSVVLPYTVINEYEVWGGNPAQFIKFRHDKKK